MGLYADTLMFFVW